MNVHSEEVINFNLTLQCTYTCKWCYDDRVD